MIEKVIQKIKDFSTKAILVGGTDKEVMESIGIHNDDIVILSFVDNLAASTPITLRLKETKIKNIIVKMPHDDHKHLLEKVRAKEVIVPYGETRFQPEDKVLALVKRTSEPALREML